MNKITPISFSSLKTFATCPLKFKFTKIDNLPKPDNYYATVGSLVHEYLAYGKYSIEAPLEAIEEAKQIVENYHRTFEPTLVEQQIAFDSEWNEVDFDDENAMIRGIIDAVVDDRNGNYTIIDYKTNHQPDADPLQLELYAYMWYKKVKDIKSITTRFEFVRLNKSTEKTYEAFDLETSDLPELIARYIEKMQEAVDNNTFEPVVGTHCSYCPYSGICPQYTTILSMKGYKMPTNDKELKDLLIRQKLHEVEAKKIKELVNAYCDTVGDHESEEIVIKHTIAQRKYLPLSAVVEYYYRDHPEKLNELKISLTNIKDKEEKRDLEKFAELQSYERLIVKPKKG